MNNYLLALLPVIILILTALNETTVAGTQHNLPNDTISQNNSIQSSLNSTNTNSESDVKQIFVTWLEANETETDNTPVINITSQEFWKTFSPLLEISTYNTINAFE